MSRILIVEDEREMAELLVQALSESGYVCDVASDGATGLKKAPSADLLLVDVMLPIMNGFVVVEKLREQGLRMPVIYLSAKDATKDIVRGLEAGADDYLVKPFKLDELLARMRAALRRARDTSQFLTWSDLRLDAVKRTCDRGGRELFLSVTEFALMELFLRHPEAVLAKQSILKEVWHDAGYRDDNIVETYVNYLRRKTEANGGSRVIQTVRGKGYILAVNPLEP